MLSRTLIYPEVGNPEIAQCGYLYVQVLRLGYSKAVAVDGKFHKTCSVLSGYVLNYKCMLFPLSEVCPVYLQCLTLLFGLQHFFDLALVGKVCCMKYPLDL